MPLYWKTNQYPDEKYAEVMESLYLPPAKRINNERLLDTQKLKYSYEWEDIATAVKDKTRSAKYLKNKALLFIQILQFGLKISTMLITNLYLIDILA